MKVNMIQGGDQAFGALLYKPPAEKTMNYFKESMANAYNALGGLASGFMDAGRNIYDSYYSSNVLNASKAVLMQSGIHMNQDTIYYVGYNDIPNTNMVMQQYIMAEPHMNELYRTNQCNAFEGTYFDIDPDNSGEDKLLYQRVMDGVVQYDNEGNGYTATYSNIDDVELDLLDKSTIYDTWANIRRMMLEGIDPSDLDGGEL